MAHLNQPAFLLGHGVENPSDGIHGDEEYLYVVELPNRIPVAPPKEWTVKVSDHCGFPRWVGPTHDAFEQASWRLGMHFPRAWSCSTQPLDDRPTFISLSIVPVTTV